MAQITIQQAFDLAMQHHQAGRLAEAENLYRQILALQPAHFDAMHLLGVLAHQVGRDDIAVDLIRRAIAFRPDIPQAYFNLGNALKDRGELDEAIAAYRQAVALQPDFAQAHFTIGVLLRDKGRFTEAVAAYRQAIALNPNVPEIYNNLGNALREKGDRIEAIAAYRQAIALNPNLSEAYRNLGEALREKGDLDDAVMAYRQAITLKPGDAESHINLGNTLRERGQLSEAITAYRQAIWLQPNDAQAHSNLGNALKDQHQFDDAVAAYRQAVALNPNLPGVYSNLGAALSDKGQLDEAIAAYRRAIALKPDDAEAYNNLGVALKDQGKLDEGIAAYRQAIALKPDYAAADSNLVLALHYHPGYDAESIAEEHRRWNREHAEPLRKFIQPHLNNRDPDRRLRIGYVSPDFHDHSVSHFVLPLLAAHDHEAFEIFGYAQVSVPDKMTAKLKAHCDTWRSIVGLSDERAAERIRQDQIDILVDLAGHTADNRLLVFARKPAPVQVTWLGYPDTTGLSTIDYRFTDGLADPPGLTDRFCSEQLFRLPQTNWCFQPRENAPRVSELPAIANQYVTFGCFNNFAKVTQPMLKLWARILDATLCSKLLIKAKSLSCPTARERVRQLMSEAGIEPDRLVLTGLAPSAVYLAQYDRIDIALDTYPYHGTTTTCEALWMGVPVVSLAGDRYVSRVGVSLLTNVGLSELIADTPERYEQIAVELANDLPRLELLRSTLRRRMEQSPLMDAAGFAADVEVAYRRDWCAWCETVSTSSAHFPPALNNPG